MIKLSHRLLVLILWFMWLIIHPIYQILNECYWAYKRCNYVREVKHEFHLNNRIMIRDFKSGRAWRTKEQKDADRKKAMDDL